MAPTPGTGGLGVLGQGPGWTLREEIPPKKPRQAFLCRVGHQENLVQADPELLHGMQLFWSKADMHVGGDGPGTVPAASRRAALPLDLVTPSHTVGSGMPLPSSGLGRSAI